MRKLNQGHFYTLFQTEGGKKYTLLSGTFPCSPFIGVHPSRGQFPTALTLFRLGGGGGRRGFSNTLSGKIVITLTPKEL